MLLNTRPLAPLNGASSHFLYLWHDVNTPSYRHHTSPWSLPAILHGGKLLPELAENPIGSYRASWMGKDHWLFTRQKRASWGSLDPLIPSSPWGFSNFFQAAVWTLSGPRPGFFRNRSEVFFKWLWTWKWGNNQSSIIAHYLFFLTCPINPGCKIRDLRKASFSNLESGIQDPNFP